MSGYGFGRRLRLLKAADFQRVFQRATYKSSHRQILVLARPAEGDHPRLGLVIAKKNIRLAVDRNRVKRLIRESFRHRQHELGAIDFVVLARRGLDELDNTAIQQLLEKQWRRIIKQSTKQPSLNEK
ncbi:ribonuclease P protein component [Endozoicomonadaceae bacterium StTr2]